MRTKAIFALAALPFILSACTTTDSDYYRADTWSTSGVNQAQQVREVTITRVAPVKIAVNNNQARDDNSNVGMVVGALIGAAAGHHVKHSGSAAAIGAVAGGAIGNMAATAATGSRTTYAEGVQITYRYNDKLYSSAQVGRVCEYQLGLAYMISATATETRIQPNNPAGCPTAK